MDETPPPIPPIETPAEAVRPRRRAAVVSLTLGILSIPTSLVLLGGLFGAAGLAAGLRHLRREPFGARGLAWAGVVSSGLGVTLALALGVYVGVSVYKTEMNRRAIVRDLQQWVGAPAPDLRITTVDGEALALSELRGRRVVLEFWRTRCPVCHKGVRDFNRLTEETTEQELVVLGLTREDSDALETFLARNEVNYPVASVNGEDLPMPYSRTTAVPLTLFIDANGIIHHVTMRHPPYDALKSLALAPEYDGPLKDAPQAAAGRVRSKADGAGLERSRNDGD